MTAKRILVACEFSGVVRDEFIVAGFDAVSCDILPTESKGPHITGDVLPLLREPWDLVIAHPPCTFLCNSGVRWLHEREGRWQQMREGAEFFLACLNANAPCVAVENPVMHRYAREVIGRGPDCTVQPWEHGDPYTKRTAFWLKGLPPLVPSKVVEGREAACHKEPPSADRAKNRSRTYPGIARAMVEQWASFV